MKSRRLAKTRCTLINFCAYLNLYPFLPLQQGIGIVECQTPIDIESIKNIYFERTFHFLFTLIEEGPPPILVGRRYLELLPR